MAQPDAISACQNILIEKNLLHLYEDNIMHFPKFIIWFRIIISLSF